jgi:hypothetical protein
MLYTMKGPKMARNAENTECTECGESVADCDKMREENANRKEQGKR